MLYREVSLNSSLIYALPSCLKNESPPKILLQIFSLTESLSVSFAIYPGTPPVIAYIIILSGTEYPGNILTVSTNESSFNLINSVIFKALEPMEDTNPFSIQLIDELNSTTITFSSKNSPPASLITESINSLFCLIMFWNSSIITSFISPGIRFVSAKSAS